MSISEYSVQSVIDEADEALNDKSRRISDSPISEALTGALGAGVFFPTPLLTFTSGVFLQTPLSTLLILKYLERKKLRQAKELAYIETIKRQTAILKALKDEMNADKERLEYLQSLNTMLQFAIKDLGHDLGYL